jgi:hypothetical protein
METNQNQQAPENRPSVPGSGSNRDTETSRIDSDAGTNADYNSNNPSNAGATSAVDNAAAAGARSGADLDDAETRDVTGEVDETYDAIWGDENDFSDTADDSDDDLDDDDRDDEDLSEDEDEDDY